MNSEPSFDESSDLFDSESNQLQDIMEPALKSKKLTISQIVQLYYQVMKVSSISKLLDESFQSSIDPKADDLRNPRMS